MSKKFTVTYWWVDDLVIEDVDADYFEIVGNVENVILFKDNTFNQSTAAFANFIKVELKGE